MKNFNTLFFGLLALTSITAHAMQLEKITNVPKPVTPQYALGAACCRTDIVSTSCIVQQYIYPEESQCSGKPTGFISYDDTTCNGVTRYIRYFEIYDAALRGQGIGTQCLAKFIEQSISEGVNRITLTSANRAISLYKKAGFEMIDLVNSMQKSLIHSNPYNPLSDTAL